MQNLCVCIYRYKKRFIFFGDKRLSFKEILIFYLGVNCRPCAIGKISYQSDIG